MSSTRLFFLKSLQPLFRRNLPNKLKQRETKKKHRNRRNAPGVIYRVLAKKKQPTKKPPKHPNTHFLVRQLLSAPQKKNQQEESSHGTLEWLLHAVSSRWKSQEDASQICVWWCVCPGGVYGGGAGLGLIPRLFMYEMNWSGISASTSLASRAMLSTWLPVRSM